MRTDLAKVVTERPRHGHKNPSKKTGLKVDVRLVGTEFDDELDFGPTRYPISRRRQHGSDAKDFSDLINPLRRLLKSQVGQHWDKIYSELSQSLDRRSISGQHIWDHVWNLVEKNPIKVDGKWCHPTAIYGFYPIINGFYIHPKTKQLQHQRHKRVYPSDRSENDVVKISSDLELRKENEIWFQYTFHTETFKRTEFDMKLRVYKVVNRIERRATKKQLNKKELRNYNLNR
jgi:hypothetical protein